MIITQLTDMACSSQNCIKFGQNAAFALDSITAVALLALGVLSLTGVLGMCSAAGWALIGAGAVYSIVMLLALCNKAKVECSG